ncbi:MAG: TonB-dependent receptor plug domain-containing protein, partial [Neisseriaceae bacterium]|nr:TonB-dependent receptor plug domain-containing protein [Neisseriaceae bacterium]
MSPIFHLHNIKKLSMILPTLLISPTSLAKPQLDIDTDETSSVDVIDYEQNQSENTSKFILDPVTVTGYGFLYNKYNIPGSVDIITSNQIDEANIKTLDDLKAKVAGLTFQNNNAAGDSFIFIRGIGDFVDEYGKSTQVLIDGIPLENVEMRNILLQDEVKSIEILKGPQNVLYGPYAKAGAIDIKTKVPTKSGGSVCLGIGNDKQKNAYFNYNHVFNP